MVAVVAEDAKLLVLLNPTKTSHPNNSNKKSSNRTLTKKRLKNPYPCQLFLLKKRKMTFIRPQVCFVAPLIYYEICSIVFVVVQTFSRHGSRHIAAGSTDFYNNKPRTARADVAFEMGSQSVIDWRKSSEPHDSLLRSMRKTNFNLRTNDSVQTCFLLAVCSLRTNQNLSTLQRESHSCGAIRTGHGIYVHPRW